MNCIYTSLFYFSYLNYLPIFRSLIQGLSRKIQETGKSIWNCAANIDVLDFRAISLIDTLRKWGFFSSDHEVNEMKEEQLQNFENKIAVLYIFGDGELVDLTFWILIIPSLQKPSNLCLTTRKKAHSEFHFSSQVYPWNAWMLLGGLFGSWVRFVKLFKITLQSWPSSGPELCVVWVWRMPASGWGSLWESSSFVRSFLPSAFRDVTGVVPEWRWISGFMRKSSGRDSALKMLFSVLLN